MAGAHSCGGGEIEEPDRPDHQDAAGGGFSRGAGDFSGDLGTMAIDPAKIRDAINHLLLNAVKFTPDGGAITVAANRSDGSLSVSITDTGCGIEEAELKRYGEAFFTGFDVARHSSGTYEHGKRGLGLGASVVKKFVDMHGGKVQVQSCVGKGTTATITLPEKS
jgi:signal transduction histidine kinase